MIQYFSIARCNGKPTETLSVFFFFFFFLGCRVGKHRRGFGRAPGTPEIRRAARAPQGLFGNPKRTFLYLGCFKPPRPPLFFFFFFFFFWVTG